MKKILAVLMAVVLVATLSISAALTASATDEPTIVVSSATANPGDNVDITITFANNPGITTAKLKIAHTDDVTVNSVTFNKAELGGTVGTSKTLDTNPLLLNWSNGGEDISGNTLFATINFTVNAGATAGDKPLTVTYKAADFSTVDEEEVAFEISNGVITVTGCEHANTTEVSAVASTCKTQGHGAYTVCSDCGAVISGSDALLDLDPTNHEGDTEVRDAVAATCTAGGYTGDTYCLGCNTKIADGQSTDALGHTGGTANCHAKAICTRCKQAYGDLDPTNHDGATEVRDAVPATCASAGYSGDTYCLGCNTKIATGSVVPATEHSLGEWLYDETNHWKVCADCQNQFNVAVHDYNVVVTNPTCTAGGYTTHTCKVCGYNYKSDETDALGHTGGTANCHAKAICTRCQQAYGDLDPNNHDGATEVRDAVPATCTAAGYTGDTYCLGCNTKIANGTTVKKLGHDYKSVVTPPTCTEKGYTTYTCTRCVDSYVADYVDALGHTGGTANCHAKAICTRCQQAYGDLDPNNHDGATEVRDAVTATCTADGYTGDTYCLGCNTKIATGTTVTKLGHDYKSVVTPPTCTENGYTTYTCTRCVDSYVADYVDALGHTGGTANCHAKAICTRCHQAYGDLDPNNHDGATEVRNAKEPTTEAAGYTGDTYCLGCGVMIEKGKEIPALIVYDADQTAGDTVDNTAVYNAQDSKAVAFTAKFATKGKFAGVVKVNDVVVEKDNYDVIEDDEGNVKVTLKEDYLKSLGNGNYTITVVADDGYAQSTFTVKNVAGGSGETPSSSKTGDADIALLVIALIAMMGASLFAGTIYRKNNESK